MISLAYISGKAEVVKDDTPHIVRQAGARKVERALCNKTEFLARALYAIMHESPHNCDDLSGDEYVEVRRIIFKMTLMLRECFLEIKDATEGLPAYMNDLKYCVDRLNCIIKELEKTDPNGLYAWKFASDDVMGAIDMEADNA